MNGFERPHKQQTTPLKSPEIKRILTYLDAKNAYRIAILRIHLHFTTSRLLKKNKNRLEKAVSEQLCFFFFWYSPKRGFMHPRRRI